MKKIISLLFYLYLLFLIWVLLLKFGDATLLIFRAPELWQINWQPFKDTGGLVQTLANVLIFLPFGLLARLKSPRFGRSLLWIFLTSLGIELLQWLTSWGVADMTDLITNTLGGLIGIVLISLFRRSSSAKGGSK